jgi:hypothetical protein
MAVVGMVTFDPYRTIDVFPLGWWEDLPLGVDEFKPDDDDES